MGQVRANQWARTAQKHTSQLRSRRTTAIIAALLAGSIYIGLRRAGAGHSSTRSLLAGLTSGGTAGGSVPVDDSIVFGVFVHRERIAQVKAGRPWRKGHRTVVASDMEELPVGLAEDAAQHRETWKVWWLSGSHKGNCVCARYYPDFRFAWHAGDRRGAMLPLLVLRELGDTFRWLFYGDDDTMWLRPNPDILVEAYDPNEPLVLTDNWWPDNEKGLFHTHYGLRCLPCHLKPPGSNGTTRVAQGFRAVFACDTPCTPKLLCDNLLGYGEYWNVWLNGTNGFNCTNPNETGTRWQMPYIYALHGGGGAILSVGALRHVNQSAEVYESCTGAELKKQNTGSDAILTRCLWAVGLAVTDPGFAALPPGSDPASFPDAPLRIDDPHIVFNVERRRLFGGSGYSNWRDIRGMLQGLPPRVHGVSNLTYCPEDASLCDRDSQADFLRRAVTTHVAARDIPGAEAHLDFMAHIWQRFSEWRSAPVDGRPPMNTAAVWAVSFR